MFLLMQVMLLIKSPDILIFLKKVPNEWYSQAQNTVESSTFGSEFITMR